MANEQAFSGYRHSFAPQTAVSDHDSLAFIRKGYCSLVVLSSVFQLLFFHDADNFACVVLAMASSIIGLVYSLHSERLRSFPISCLMLMFFTTTSISGALIVKTVEWAALVDRLQVPLTTFSVLAAFQVILIGAHVVYVRLPSLQGLKRFISRRIYSPCSLFSWPTDMELWLLGVLGCLAVAASGTDYESAASFGMASAGQKILRAFQFLKYAPFLVPFRRGLSGQPTAASASYTPLIAYFGALVILSFATNSRSTFADAVPTLGICILLAVAYQSFTLKNVPTWKFFAVGIAAVAASTFLSRLALAMVVVRDFRYDLDVVSLMKLTFEALGNDEWLEIAKAKMNSAVFLGNYSEEYVNSRFAARFLLTKFHDNMFYYLSFFGPDHISSYSDFMFDRLWALIPEPLLQKMGITLNKEDLIISNGDYIVYMIDGWGLGGFKTGSMAAEIYAVFGWFSPLVLSCAAIMLFVVYDAFVIDSYFNLKAIAPLVILLAWNLVGTTSAFGLGSESVVAIPGGIIRTLPQNIIFYLLAVAGVRPLAKMF